MPAVDPKKLKRLMVTELLIPFAIQRQLSGGQLADLVRRAMSDKHFDLSAVLDEFASYMDEDQASDWAFELERSGQAPHLFLSVEDDPSKAEQMYGGVKKDDFNKMSPEQRLAIANAVEFERGKRKAD
jgi:hypothetical protein